jgi:ABC-type phosphate transport system auxiliary subunit
MLGKYIAIALIGLGVFGLGIGLGRLSMRFFGPRPVIQMQYHRAPKTLIRKRIDRRMDLRERRNRSLFNDRNQYRYGR